MLRRKISEGWVAEEGDSIYLTEGGVHRMREHLARLKKAVPGYIDEAARTAAYGDRSDNAEYKEAKRIQRSTQWQILTLEDELKRVVMIGKGPSATGAVQLGSIVVVSVDGKEKIFRILGPRETDPTKGIISDKSPLGAALIGHKKGDVVTIKTASGSRECRILEIK